jgi:hypothetical protein
LEALNPKKQTATLHFSNAAASFGDLVLILKMNSALLELLDPYNLKKPAPKVFAPEEVDRHDALVGRRCKL